MKKIKQLNKKSLQKGVLFFLCLLAGADIVLVAVRTGRMKSSGMPVVQPITVPRYFPMPNPGWSRAYDAKEEVVIESFQRWMDSLRNDSLDKPLYDSICRMRPGLLDSARTAAHYYYLYHLLK